MKPLSNTSPLRLSSTSISLLRESLTLGFVVAWVTLESLGKFVFLEDAGRRRHRSFLTLDGNVVVVEGRSPHPAMSGRVCALDTHDG